MDFIDFKTYKTYTFVFKFCKKQEGGKFGDSDNERISRVVGHQTELLGEMKLIAGQTFII